MQGQRHDALAASTHNQGGVNINDAGTSRITRAQAKAKANADKAATARRNNASVNRRNACANRPLKMIKCYEYSQQAPGVTSVPLSQKGWPDAYRDSDGWNDEDDQDEDEDDEDEDDDADMKAVKK